MRTRLPPLLTGAAIILTVLLMFPQHAYNDPDTFWHLELGQYMIKHQTVLHHAIHTYHPKPLPYVPHEYAFQIVSAFLYRAFGWPGTYLLTAFSLFMLIAGLDRLTRISRKETGFGEGSGLLIVLLLPICVWIYYMYFTTRPQMVSAWMIVWFFVFLREFQRRPRLKYAALMTLLSLAVANFHAGVWLVPAVFTGMAVLESLIERNLDAKRTAVFLSVLLAGLLNPGGLKSLLFIFTVTQDDANMLISEWQPIAFTDPENLPILLAVLFFAILLPHALHRKPFRYLFMLGILCLGLSGYKQNLFLWLFVPYFAATAVEAVPALRRFHFSIGRKTLAACAAAGLLFNTAWVFAHPPSVEAQKYPVSEMNFILGQTPDGDRPKVMAPYGVSGYVMFRGGDVLADGRQDPFITEASKGKLGWNAFQRSMHGYGEFLPEVVAEDRPDFVIVREGVSWKLVNDWKKLFGEPVYRGAYGSVFDVRS